LFLLKVSRFTFIFRTKKTERAMTSKKQIIDYLNELQQEINCLNRILDPYENQRQGCWTLYDFSLEVRRITGDGINSEIRYPLSAEMLDDIMEVIKKYKHQAYEKLDSITIEVKDKPEQEKKVEKLTLKRRLINFIRGIKK
jgi:hypothetical protein